jgi:hypothetical protein
MTHKPIPCPKCDRIWLWLEDKDPKNAFCPDGHGCAAEKDDEDSVHEKLEEIATRLNRIEDDLRWIVRYLLSSNQPTQPSPDIPNPFPTIPTLSNKVYCPKCGMEWSGVMGYVCNDQRCPIQMKVSC